MSRVRPMRRRDRLVWSRERSDRQDSAARLATIGEWRPRWGIRADYRHPAAVRMARKEKTRAANRAARAARRRNRRG